ncbi:glycosyltransferase family protein [Salegentibacter mishustinae]|uniref:glycosyltransferase family protein n=1 Tax=Salegentibacter mishustinae TaxID=270918 RepID=UPI0024939C6D|nr:glycosyltransferase family protein [Salegentibacter mishustinae]
MLSYYAHHHGSGHCNYAQIFSKAFDYESVIFTSSNFQFNPNVKTERLASEDPDGTGTDQKFIPPPAYLHYSPVGQKTIQHRSAQILNRIIREEVKLMIIDVSAEIAALARSASIPYSYVRLPGERNDPGHLQAFQGAVFLLAYFPEAFESSNTPAWVKEKTIYLGFFNRFSKINQVKSTHKNNYIKNVVVLSGKGGNKELLKAIPCLQKRFHYSEINVYGAKENPAHTGNLSFRKSTTNFLKTLYEADLIVANCGLNLTSEIIETEKPFLSIPELRPFNEQEYMHAYLLRNKLALDLDFIEKHDDKTIQNKPVKNQRFINQSAPELFRYWIEKYQYNPEKLRKNLAEIQTQLYQDEIKPNYHI